MFSQAELQNMLSAFTEKCKTLFGEKLLDVRLYGSYARGDQEKYSDIDVMVLLDMDDSEARKHLKNVCDIASDVSLAHNGMNLSPFVGSKEHYDMLKNFPGFYNNVMMEGVSTVVR